MRPDHDRDHAAHAPIIGVDIWEHAFYLQYKNVKPDVRARASFPYNPDPHPIDFFQYLKAIWHVIDFKEAQKRYQEATGGPRL